MSEREKNLARMKEIGFKKFIQEKAPQWFRDNQWKELFLELVNMDNGQI